MRLLTDAFAPLALGAAVAVALSACAVPHAPAAPSPKSTTGSTGVPVTAEKSPGPATAGPYQRAVADADAILASFAVPPGAQRLSAAPTVEKGVLKTASQIPETPDLVDKSEWWIAPGTPQDVLAWEVKHLPSRFSTSGTGSSSGPGFRTWTKMSSLPDIPGVLDQRQLLVTVAQDGDKTAVRVDAQVSWQPARPASEQVPAAAEAVTISMNLGSGQGGALNQSGGLNQSGSSNRGGTSAPKPVTITDRAKVAALKALINGLPLFPPAVFNCPADFGDDLVLTFRAGPGTPALAVATVDFAGCDGVDLTIGGKSQPSLAGPGTDNGPRILKIAGLSWKVPAL